MMCRKFKCWWGSVGVQRVGLFHEHTCRTQHAFYILVFVFFLRDVTGIFPWQFHLSTWGRRCLDHWGCFWEPAESGGLCLGGKVVEREWPVSGDSSTRQITAEPRGRQLGEQEDYDKQWQRGGSEEGDRAAEGEIGSKDQLRSLPKWEWILNERGAYSSTWHPKFSRGRQKSQHLFNSPYLKRVMCKSE